MKPWNEIFFEWIEQLEDYDSRYEIFEQDFENPLYIESLHSFSGGSIPLDICKIILEEADSNRSLCENDERVMYRASEYFYETMSDEIKRLFKNITNKRAK